MTGGALYEWNIDGVVAGNGPSLSHTFPGIGKYGVTLKVSMEMAGCFASYTDFVIVDCGVMARFYPDKRIIASKGWNSTR